MNKISEVSMKSASMFIAALSLVGCSTSSESIIITSVEPPGEECAQGGFKVESGVDQNNNSQLDAEEVSSIGYTCNGERGETGDQGDQGITGPSGLCGERDPLEIISVSTPPSSVVVGDAPFTVIIDTNAAEGVDITAAVTGDGPGYVFNDTTEAGLDEGFLSPGQARLTIDAHQRTGTPEPFSVWISDGCMLQTTTVVMPKVSAPPTTLRLSNVDANDGAMHLECYTDVGSWRAPLYKSMGVGFSSGWGQVESGEVLCDIKTARNGNEGSFTAEFLEDHAYGVFLWENSTSYSTEHFISERVEVPTAGVATVRFWNGDEGRSNIDLYVGGEDVPFGTELGLGDMIEVEVAPGTLNVWNTLAGAPPEPVETLEFTLVGLDADNVYDVVLNGDRWADDSFVMSIPQDAAIPSSTYTQTVLPVQPLAFEASGVVEITDGDGNMTMPNLPYPSLNPFVWVSYPTNGSACSTGNDSYRSFHIPGATQMLFEVRLGLNGSDALHIRDADCNPIGAPLTGTGIHWITVPGDTASLSVTSGMWVYGDGYRVEALTFDN